MERRNSPDEEGITPRVALLGDFALRWGGAVVAELPLGSQHLLALLALRGRPMSRETLAGELWPGASAPRAFANLRSAIFPLRSVADTMIVSSDADIALAPDVVIDLHEAARLHSACWMWRPRASLRATSLRR